MDAVEYLRAKTRMTSRIDSVVCTISCNDCPLSSSNNKAAINCKSFESHYPEKAVAIIEKWAAEHRIKTRLSEILKLFPKANDNAILAICPSRLDTSLTCRCIDDSKSCVECCKAFWLAEVE